MTGSLRRRGKSSFELKFDVGADPITGKRRIRYVSFKGNRRAAEIELARLVSENAAGAGIDPSRITIGEFIDRWIRDWAASNLSAKTLERYKQLLDLYVRPHIGALRIQKLRPVNLSELYAKLLREGGKEGRGLSARSVGHVHRVVHRMLGHAATWGIITQNVAAVVKPPKVPETEIGILTADQIGKLLASIEGRTLRPIVSFLLGTGCRRGEVLALRWSDIDFSKGRVRIERAIEQTKAGLKIKSPKTRNGRRNVAIAPSLVAELRAHKTRQQERRLAIGLGHAPEDALVFARWDGAMRSPHWLTQKFSQATKPLGIDCHLHALRHTHVSALISAGMDVLTISRRIGHGSPVITLAVYSHMFDNTDARAAEIMEAMLPQAKR